MNVAMLNLIFHTSYLSHACEELHEYVTHALKNSCRFFIRVTNMPWEKYGSTVLIMKTLKAACFIYQKNITYYFRSSHILDKVVRQYEFGKGRL